ncbi:MAG: CCA tRNA nucleotidyltransferase [Planctomycetes bacterium]|nr:CCA tRNA nucleotidyltransferase [Planctomycetota bacterium]
MERSPRTALQTMAPDPPKSARKVQPPIAPRAAALAIARVLRAQGHVAYLAGGCVRDELLGIEPADYDLATDARPEQIQSVFPKARGVGESFGVMLVRFQGRTVEVATFRSDGPYHDGRRPSEVRYATAEEDAKRRDFTINGLFRDTESGSVVDFVNGQHDLDRKVLRAIGDPHARIREDRLRSLRAVRFAARFSLHVDRDTQTAIEATAAELKGVSRERVGGELRRMLAHPTRHRAIELLERWQLDASALGEAHSDGALARVAALPAHAPFATALAAWSLDRDARAVSVGVEGWSDSINLSTRERTDLAETRRIVGVLAAEWGRLSKAKRKRLASSHCFSEALHVLAGSDAAHAGEVRAAVEALACESGGLAPPPLVRGDDLLKLGFLPGPAFKEVLDGVYDLQLEGEVSDPAAGIAAAVELWKQFGSV